MRDYRTDTVRELDEAVWRTVVPGRDPLEVAATLRSWGVTNARDGAEALMREADPAAIARTAGLDPLDPTGGPLERDVIAWSLANMLRHTAGMALDNEGTTP